jgi:hypothetical protein
VGDSRVAKEEIVVLGGILFAKGIQGKCHLQHLTLRQAKSGVYGESSFTMDDVIVVVMVFLRLALASSSDVPTWKCSNVGGVGWLHPWVPPSH